jgi:hypothetical protein
MNDNISNHFYEIIKLYILKYVSKDVDNGIIIILQDKNV